MNQNFFLWYYTRGLVSLVATLRDVLRFVLHLFHISGLFTTLLSPWKRDVTSKDWLGFHPLRSLQAFAENAVSRFLGALVRGIVLLFGLFVLGVSAVCSLFILLFFVFAPPLLLVGILTRSPLVAGLGALFILGSVIEYFKRDREQLETTDITVLAQERWFETLLARLGLLKKDQEAGVFGNTESFQRFLTTRGIQWPVFEQVVHEEYIHFHNKRRKSQSFVWENLRKRIPIGKGWHYAYTPHLDRYALDLSEYDPTPYKDTQLVGRKEEWKMMTLILKRPSQNSVLLIGDPGIGKKTLVHELARLIRENEFVDTSLGDARVLLFDIGSAISDALNQGIDVDSALRALLIEAASAGNIILVVENIDSVIGGTSNHPDISSVLAEFLALPRFRFVATVSTAHYHALAKRDEAVFRFFEMVIVRETTEEETLLVLLERARHLEGKTPVFTFPSLLSIVKQSSRYKWEVPFPERALDLAQETLAYWQNEGSERFITPQTVEALVTLKTGVPTGAILEDEKVKLLNLEELLHARVIGQHTAVKQVAEAFRRARAGLGDAKRPLGSFIFLGPTGVGKTEMVKALAESYFGSEDRMIRLDMSEYQNEEAVARLIGSEALGQTGKLTDSIKENPFSIVLLDELEKAYPKALDIFLQILDEGYVTDSAGDKVSFRNTIIIATSNAGAALIKAGIQAETPFKEVRKQVLDFVVEQGIYRLEFLNRFDGIIFFEPLKTDELLVVTTHKLEALATRLKKDKDITLTFAPGVSEKVVSLGYEPEFGARSINRYIEDSIEDVIVSQIISGSVASGGSLTVTPEELPDSSL